MNNLVNSNRALKATALLYLKEALGQERYEECAELIESAKELGAAQSDIDKVIGRYLNKSKTEGENEANIKGRRF